MKFDEDTKVEAFTNFFKSPKGKQKLKRFVSKYEKDLEKDGLPENAQQPKLELKSTEYMKLYMQKQGWHEDREKASWISQNLSNKNFTNANYR